jgi:type VI secretion system secreted protein Hcp
MAVDIFLKLDGIEGESTDHKHKGEIALESFSWGASNSSSVNEGGGGGGAGKVTFQDFSFTAKVGTQSSQLFRALLEGRHIRNGTLTVNNGREVETVVMLNEILVSSYKENVDVTTVQCDRDDQKTTINNTPTESVSLNFAKIEFKSS